MEEGKGRRVVRGSKDGWEEGRGRHERRENEKEGIENERVYD